MAQKFVTGQPYGKNATVLPTESSLRLTQQRRVGEWGRTSPESTAAFKSRQRSSAKSQALHGGQYFGNNTVQRQREADKRTVDAFMQRKQAIDSRG